VNDGTRTRDIRHHKPALYQLSYAHHAPDVAIGPPEVYPVERSSSHPANAVVTSVAAACASSEDGPGSGAKTVRR
jgi:hypothetical protein